MATKTVKSAKVVDDVVDSVVEPVIVQVAAPAVVPVADAVVETDQEVAERLMVATKEAQAAYRVAQQQLLDAQVAVNKSLSAWAPIVTKISNAYANSGNYDEEFCAPIVARFVAALREQLGGFMADVVLPRLELDAWSYESTEPDLDLSEDVIEFVRLNVDSGCTRTIRKTSDVLASIVAYIGVKTGGDRGIVGAAQQVASRMSGGAANRSALAVGVRPKRDFVSEGLVNLPGVKDAQGGLVVKLHRTVSGEYRATFGGASRAYYLQRVGIESTPEVIEQIDQLGDAWALAEVERLGL